MTIAPERPQTDGALHAQEILKAPETPAASRRSKLEELIVHVLHPDVLRDILYVEDLVRLGINPNDTNLISIEVFSHRFYPKAQFAAKHTGVLEIVAWVNKALSYSFTPTTSNSEKTADELREHIATWWLTPNSAIKFDDQYDTEPRTPYDCLRQLREQVRRVDDVPGQLRKAVAV